MNQPARQHAYPTTVGLDEWVTSPTGMFRACFTDLGEGISGEYDETDPTDEPLLRVDVQVRAGAGRVAEEDASLYNPDDTGWWTARDGSLCTNVNADKVTGAQRARLLARLLAEIDGETDSIKRPVEQFSWIKADSADAPPAL